MRLPILRPYWVLFHRWAGWVLAIVLVLLGLTGSLLAFYEPLDRAGAHRLQVVPQPHPAARAIDPIELRAQLLARHPQLRMDHLSLHRAEGQAARFHVLPLPGSPGEPTYDEVFVDPYTGRELGHRLWGDITQGPVNLMPFVYRLHYSLAMGEAGSLVLGLLALFWTVDCFVGAYLTFPARQARRTQVSVRGSGSWWSRWRPAWRMRWSASSYKFHFDLHRTGGLWLWAMLFVFAWSGVAFNLQAVYKPAMSALLLPYSQAQDALTSRDIRDRHGATRLYFDVDTGRLMATDLPTGRFAGNTVTTWLLALHMAQVGGLAFRIFVCLAGLGVVALSVTGLVIWWRKRRARQVLKQHRSTAPAV